MKGDRQRELEPSQQQNVHGSLLSSFTVRCRFYHFGILNGHKVHVQTAIQTLNPYQWFRLIVIYLLIPLVLLVSGWDPGWWQAWVYSFLVIAAGVGGRIWAERRHPGLLAERSNFERSPDVKPWDKVLAPLMALSVSFPLFIPAGLDHHFGWSPVFPVWLNILGLILIALGYAFAGWALTENRFFSGVVRIQADRGHVVRLRSRGDGQQGHRHRRAADPVRRTAD